MIVWNPATRTEHFIRRATFQGESRDFGFLVPTPTIPVLTAVDDEVFSLMEKKTTPRTEYRTEKEIDWTPLLLMPFASRNKGEGMPAVASAPVQVLSTQKVAGYEAAILEASDASALNTWLTEHGYATTPELTAWLDEYVQRQWIISAFKIDKTQTDLAAQTSAVRMSFTTDRPFFPYREPASQREGPADPRVLRVWFIGPERVEGKIGDGQTWPGQLYWSETLTDRQISGVPVAAGARLTAFEDHATPRPGVDDLFFGRSTDQSVLIQPPNVETEIKTTHVPIDVVLAPILILGVWGLRRRKRRL